MQKFNRTKRHLHFRKGSVTFISRLSEETQLSSKIMFCQASSSFKVQAEGNALPQWSLYWMGPLK